MPSKDKDQPGHNQTGKRICLGKIVAAHGVKGLVKIRPFGEDSSLLDGTLFTSENEPNTLNISLKNPLGKYILAEVEGVQDRTHAENIKGTELYVDRSALPELDGGYYFEDLAGLEVVENDLTIGKVIGVDNFGAENLLDIQLNTGQNFLLPIRDETVTDISTEENRITIQDYKGFIL